MSSRRLTASPGPTSCNNRGDLCQSPVAVLMQLAVVAAIDYSRANAAALVHAGCALTAGN